MQQPKALGNPLLRSFLGASLLSAFLLLCLAAAAFAAPPAAPTITSPAGATIQTKNTTVTFSGSAAAGSTVTLYKLVGDPAAPVALASNIAVSGGTWSRSVVLSVGVNNIGAQASNSEGPGPSSDIKVVIVDQTPPEAPTIASPVGTPASPAYLNQTAPVVQGAAEPLSSVRIYDGASLVATTTAAINGQWSVGTSALSQGTHSLRARASDPAGNDGPYSETQTVVIDTASPAAPTISAPTGSTAFIPSTSATLSGSAEDGSTITLYNNGELLIAGLATSGTSWSWSGALGSGTNVILAWAVDRAGNISPASDPKGIIVDATVPTLGITAPANNSHTSNSAPTFIFDYAEQYPAAVECRVDSGAWSACGSGNQLATLSEGQHAFSARVRDLAGNQATASTQFTVDTAPPPAPTITSGPSAPISSTTASFGFTGEPGGSFECALDTIDVWQSCSSPRVFGTLAQGGHNFYVRQLDAAGNVGAASARTWVVDTIGPASPSILGPSGTVAETTASIAFTTSETPVTYTCKHNAEVASACTSPQQLSGLGNGAQSFTVTAFDPLGNASAPTTINWTIDTSLYSVAIYGGPVGVVASASNAFEFGATLTDGTSYFCSVDDAVNFAPCGSPFSTGELGQGVHTFRVYAVNGGLTSATVSASWTIDTVGPQITITSPSPDQTTGPNGQLVFSTSDATGGVSTTCQIDNGASTPCASPASYLALEGGAHTATITATDAVGNSSSLLRYFSVDGAGPQTTINSGPPVRTNSTSATITFSADKGGSVFDCMLGEDVVTPCTGSVTFGPLADGTYVFQVRATDTLGNADPTPAIRVWTVDTQAPEPPTIGSPPVDVTTSATSLQLSGTAEPQSTIALFDGAVPLGSATSGTDGIWTLSPNPTFSVGVHNITATATDTAGNVSTASATRKITIDTTAPLAQITSPSNDAKLPTNSVSIAFTVTETNPSATLCSLNGGTYAPCSSPYVATGLSESQVHTFGLLAVDAAGNQATATVSFTIDLTPPETPSIASPADGSFVKNAGIAVLGYAEPGATVAVTEGLVELCSATADGGGQYSCTPSPPFTDGEHSLLATATDSVGHESQPSSVSIFTVDTSLPSVQITSPAAGQVLLGPSKRVSVEFTLDGTGTDASAQCSVDAGAATPCSSPWQTAPLADGLHTLSVLASDQAGNAASASVVIELDTGPPVVRIDSTPPASTTERSATVAFSADDPAASFECRLDAGSFAACSSPLTLPGPLGDGFHTFAVRASDVHGAQGTEQLYNWVVTTPLQPPTGGHFGDSDPLPKTCFANGVLITNVTPKGRSITLSGWASARHIGKRVGIAFKSKPSKSIGSATVRANGEFSLKVKAPTKSQQRSKKAAYRASIGSERSSWAPLAARIGRISASYSGSKLNVSGTLVKPLAPSGKVLVKVRAGCNGRFEQNGDADVESSGKFQTSFPFATDRKVVYVQLEAAVQKSKKSRKTQKVKSPIIPVLLP